MLMWIARGLRNRLLNRVGYAILRSKGVSLGNKVRFHGLPIVSLAPRSTINIADRVVLCSESASTALGVSRPVILRTLYPDASISIAEEAGLSGTVICAASRVEIGPECLVGADVIIADTNFHSIVPEGRRSCIDKDSIGFAPVKIGRNVFVGARSVILKGVTVGDDAVIGAGSVVTRNIPEGAIAAGNPARIVGSVRGAQKAPVKVS